MGISLHPESSAYPDPTYIQAREIMVRKGIQGRSNIDINFEFIQSLWRQRRWKEAAVRMLPVDRFLYGIYFGGGLKVFSGKIQKATRAAYTELLADMATSNQGMPFQILMRYANILMKQKKMEEAGKALDIIEQKPEQIISRMVVGKDIRTEDVARSVGKAVFSRCRAQIAMFKGEKKEAFKFYEDALNLLTPFEDGKGLQKVDCVLSATHRMKACFHRKLGEYSKAEQSFHEAAKYATDNFWKKLSKDEEEECRQKMLKIEHRKRMQKRFEEEENKGSRSDGGALVMDVASSSSSSSTSSFVVVSPLPSRETEDGAKSGPDPELEGSAGGSCSDSSGFYAVSASDFNGGVNNKEVA
mmetsp:Transcript_10137/g.13968  ORF Transcript_10137/g.13968 Transcript_10137/m.13968 type:complete len:357 (-) Transcript_10137:380-1450(-)|eukprot:CAMPEP_0185251484 /NCGR_PEP_ID=MMETSP1359-20130426/874_1 /TAXON_ID=552665 /ORGANISM="Bigelowiella longifila, Strain CCMP242" /LENGTH=356 /DNA_ID=CAMNT_0027833397 /DNA_START=61 /DNA_END=1131 /DNA_ORIENTATION=-